MAVYEYIRNLLNAVHTQIQPERVESGWTQHRHRLILTPIFKQTNTVSINHEVLLPLSKAQATGKLNTKIFVDSSQQGMRNNQI
jgi:hypothetical protein